ncbi:MAG: NAD-dependent epimerase/dehydratase, partial [Dehalococcoidia bacterium]|nr:NAD-dependent epimerase/dehydratase [Dehalococcoidia bacterium]
MPRFLITGGAGFLGINLVRFLLARGEQVTTLDIAPFDYPDVHDQVHALRGDIRDKVAVDQAMDGVDVVVHTAAALPLYKKQDILSTDIEGTRIVLESAFQHGVRRFIHISSTAVYGVPDHHPLYETDKLIGVGAYGRAKIAAEGLCLEYRQRGMCAPIIRPKSFVGPERLGVFALLYDWAREGRGFPMLGSGRNRYQLLDVEDLCVAIYLTATLDAEKVNDTFNIGASEFATMGEDYQSVLDKAGFGKKVRPLPAVPAILSLRVLDAF